MKELIRSHLSVLIEDIKDELKENERTDFINGRKIAKRLSNILDDLMEIPEANEAMTLISRSEYEHYLELKRMYEEDNF